MAYISGTERVSTEAESATSPGTRVPGEAYWSLTLDLLREMRGEHRDWRRQYTKYSNETERRVEALERRQEADDHTRGKWPARAVIAGLTAAGALVGTYHALVVVPMQDRLSNIVPPIVVAEEKNRDVLEPLLVGGVE